MDQVFCSYTWGQSLISWDWVWSCKIVKSRFGIWKCKVIPVICLDVRILLPQHILSPLNAHCNILGKSYLLFLKLVLFNSCAAWFCNIRLLFPFPVKYHTGHHTERRREFISLFSLFTCPNKIPFNPLKIYLGFEC